ncbi:uncharacterized protein MONOS_15243 [Monocercomonoides exilis]|uniref:uncharacterized protein n=1 Tax=Monocercomonoides exilis TaxID=2049356 RepID=UPI00355988CD|nr:hypothetical protein MONOS_15243 [Monocercomonoides exilis]|eukprot:MONOS_15243.1-p1 / transcript=MONOS_15243.1 / gene=MONOS_15243 / organism=Monocercomonoides_exilis_PA203 / gene_product=unspecified product / transcript_product=unspecified product / location=Mono_scaffold01177:2025-3819(+) / protein_length=363 / sequence_SO=supercontig / SO=protein_coding / is_pseudo=false
MTFLNEVEAEASPKYHVESRKLCEEWVVQSEETEALMEEGPTIAAIGREIRKEQDSQNIFSKRQTVVQTPAKAAIFNNIIAVDAFFRIAGRAFELLFSSAAHTLQYFGASNRFGAQAALNGLNGHRMRNGGGRGKELRGTLHSSARFMTSTRSEEKALHVKMEEAKKADFGSKLSAEQRKGRKQEEPKAKKKTKKKNEFCTSQIDAFNTRLAQSTTERRRGIGEEKKEAMMDEHQQTFYSLVGTLSSSHCSLKTSQPLRNLLLLFLPCHTHNYSSSLTQKSLGTTHPSSSSSSPCSSISSFLLRIPRAILGKSRLGNAGVLARRSVSDTRDVFEPQSILLNYAAHVASQEILLGGEKEKEKE